MKERTKKSNIDGVLVLLLLAVFMVSVLFVLLTGADVVQKLTRRDDVSYDRRTATQYITTRVRQADAAGRVAVRDFGGCDAIVLTEEYDGVPYETLVYCYDGTLRELFTEAGLEQEPSYGEEILPAAAFTPEMAKKDEQDGARLTAEITVNGTEETICLYLRSGEEAAA